MTIDEPGSGDVKRAANERDRSAPSPVGLRYAHKSR